MNKNVIRIKSLNSKERFLIGSSFSEKTYNHIFSFQFIIY